MELSRQAAGTLELWARSERRPNGDNEMQLLAARTTGGGGGDDGGAGPKQLCSWPSAQLGWRAGKTTASLFADLGSINSI